MPIDLALESWRLCANGVWLTLQLTFLPTAVGLGLAIFGALAVTRDTPYLAPALRGYSTLMRGSPLLVQTLAIYSGLAQFEFVRDSWAWVLLRDPWWCAMIAFSLNAAGWWIVEIADGILETPKGEREAAKALGLTRLQATWLVVLPSTFRRLLPQCGNEMVIMLHASALASVITIQDILGAARTFNSRYYFGSEGFLVAAALYFVLSFLLVGAFLGIERRYLRHLGLGQRS